MRRLLAPLVSPLLALPTVAVAQASAPPPTPPADETGPATRAGTVGFGWSYGLVGVAYAIRTLPRVPRLGASVAAGFVGPAGRVTLALGAPTRRLVPYAGAGVVSNLWGLRADVDTDDLRATRVLPVLDAGVQLWPAGPRGLHVDVGVGVVPTAPRDVRVQPHVGIGGAFRR